MSTPSPKLESIFWAALPIEPAESRAAYLDQVCGSDHDLRARVEELLAAQPKVENFLEEPALPRDLPLGPTEIPAGPGTVIGPYKLLQEIGEGGMGTVFMAEQTQPVQRLVALKIIKPGMDSRQVIARFEAERQALAIMDHPNIAKVFDAGTVGPVCRTGPGDSHAEASGPARQAGPTGPPYFVMELVKGIAITTYCDEHRLTLKERLALFIPVCQAVMHAHQKGIIHRDLKPSNVLVARYDETPVPKVIDFGVAKATAQKLTERTLFTHFGQLVGILEYMSPEQATLNALDVDTRSDIYSLGVLLYELLAGSTPFEKKRLRETAFDEILRIIREEEPPTPSTRLSRSRLPSGTSAIADLRLQNADLKQNADLNLKSVIANRQSPPGPARQAGPTEPTLESIAAQRKTEPARLASLVRGDLDWIVMKALDKDRNRRYQTASGFAEDIQRYLADEPVLAGAPTAAYRLRKFARRHRGGVLVGVAATLLLLVLVASIAWVTRAREARNAQTSNKVKELIAAARALIDDNQPSLARQKLAEARKLIVNDRQALTEIAAQVEAFEAEEPETAGAFNQLAWLLVSHTDPNLRNPRRALELAKKAVALAPNVGRYWNTLGVAHYRSGNWHEALAALDESMKRQKDPNAWDWFFVAMAHSQLGDRDEARKWYDLAAPWAAEVAAYPAEEAIDFDNGALSRIHQEAADLLGLAGLPAFLLKVNKGRAYARSAQWAKAVACYAEAAAPPGAEEGRVGYEQACLFLLVGDEAAYRHTSTQLRDNYSHMSKLRGYYVRTWTLGAQPADDLLRAENAAAPELKGNLNGWALTASAGLYYRAGRYPEAGRILDQYLKSNPTWDGKVLDWLWLALTYHRLGKETDARQWLHSATLWLDKYSAQIPSRREGVSLHLHDWLEAHVLRREAEAVILGKKDGPKK